MGPCNDSFFSIEICLVENSVYILTNCQNIQNSNFRFSITVFFFVLLKLAKKVVRLESILTILRVLTTCS